MLLRKATRYALSACLLLLVAAVAVPNQEEKKYKDAAEYDLIVKVYGEADPAKKVALLDEWTQKYPETDYRLERTQFYLDSYQKTGKMAEAVNYAKELLEKVPGDFNARYVITLYSPYLGKSDSEFIAESKKVASEVLSSIPTQFGTKPDAVPQEEWNKFRTLAEVSAHLTIGWCQMQQNDNTGAEKSFKKVLEIDPSRGQVSYWLGQVILGQGEASKYDLAFASFARAAIYDGPNAMPVEGRAQVKEYVENLIKKYGEESFEIYWPVFEEMAKASALPSKRIELKSDAERAFEAEQKSRQENPSLWVYKDLKTALTGEAGDATWQKLNGALTPKMSLYVVSASPPERPATINLTGEPGGPVEVVLTLENRRRTGVRTGSLLTIDGVAAGLRKDPFRLTLNDGHTF